MTERFPIQGFCGPAFSPLRDAFEQNFADGLEFGAALAVFHRGQPVVDLWGGSIDQDGQRPWQEDTLVNVASATKVAAITCTLLAVERGLLDLDTPIAAYWPEFAQGGKDKATVRHALTHRAGVPGLREPAAQRLYNDVVAAAARVAAEPAWFEPGGDVSCYHALTYGLILGELVRRTDGRRPQQFFEEEIAAPMQVDFMIGVKPDVALSRIAIRYDVEAPFESGTLADDLLKSFSLDPQRRCWETLSREVLSFSGYGNARSMAKYTSIYANGGMFGGRRYLSEDLVAEAGTEQFYGHDLLYQTIRYGLGFGLHNENFPSPTPTTLHWGGYGGFWTIMDPASGVSAAYAMNRGTVDPDLQMDPRQQRFWDVLGELLPKLA